MPSLKNALAQINKPVSWLKKPRDYEGYIGIGIKLVLFALFLPLFVLAWVVAYELLSQSVQFDLFSWFSTEVKVSEPVSSSNEPSFGFAALIATILGAPFIIWRSWVAHQDYKVKEQGHITDRINKAVEGLGAEKTVKQVDGEGKTNEFTQPNLEVRIGSIYALERIAQDSLRDHIQIMEILCAYIRENAPVSNAFSFTALQDRENVKPRSDIQIAINVLGRRNKNQIQTETRANYRLDLRNTCLQRANFSELNFENAIFGYSNLALSVFVRTKLKGVSLIHCDLSGVTVTSTSLEKSDLMNATFHKASLLGLKIKSVKNLNKVDFQGLSWFAFISFQNCNLAGIQVSQEQIEHSFGDASVFLPSGISRPEHWSKESLSDKNFEKAYKKWREEPKSYTPPNA